MYLEGVSIRISNGSCKEQYFQLLSGVGGRDACRGSKWRPGLYPLDC